MKSHNLFHIHKGQKMEYVFAWKYELILTKKKEIPLCNNIDSCSCIFCSYKIFIFFSGYHLIYILLYIHLTYYTAVAMSTGIFIVYT